MTRTLLMTAAALTLAIPVAAQAAGGRAIRLIEQADANKDGATSRQEFMDFRAAEFRRITRGCVGRINIEQQRRKIADIVRTIAGVSAIAIQAHSNLQTIGVTGIRSEARAEGEFAAVLQCDGRR